ncbi:MAG TPA: P-loop NTPase, partial [Candidatus Saccharimonadales bacterium]|nr:P-loop NTPase [Candidatus Saccharimonadales bacterium]
MEELAPGEKMPAVHPSILKVIEQKKRVKEKLSSIKHKIGVYSAKGGVGKTTTAVNLAYALKSLGYKVGLLDADVDCPNVTMFLGMKDVLAGDYPLVPVEKNGIK